GLSDLARLSQVNKATCYRLMGELQNHGLVEQVGAAREYRLGPAVLRLAALREAHVPMRDAAMPVLQGLAQATGETAHVSVLSGGQLRSIAHAYSGDFGTKVIMDDVHVLPFHATSSGMAVLAHLDAATQSAELIKPLTARTSSTETDPARLALRLKEIASQGYAESAGGYEAEVHSFAVPLFDSVGACNGGLAVASPHSRVSPEKTRVILTAL
ncbi:MAG TPA: IclR family transcriptional regulator, partial [Tabrizicola sp.]|nr:IclR family transcriptional regulator [Tabrizicola sp.]